MDSPSCWPPRATPPLLSPPPPSPLPLSSPPPPSSPLPCLLPPNHLPPSSSITSLYFPAASLHAGSGHLGLYLFSPNPSAPLLPAKGLPGPHCWGPAGRCIPLLSWHVGDSANTLLSGQWGAQGPSRTPVGRTRGLPGRDLGDQAPGWGSWVSQTQARGAHSKVAGEAKPTPGGHPRPRPRPTKPQEGKQGAEEWRPGPGSDDVQAGGGYHPPGGWRAAERPAGPRAPVPGGVAIRWRPAPCPPHPTASICPAGGFPPTSPSAHPTQGPTSLHPVPS